MQMMQIKHAWGANIFKISMEIIYRMNSTYVIKNL